MWSGTVYSIMAGALAQMFGRDVLMLTKLTKHDFVGSFDLQKLVTQPHRVSHSERNMGEMQENPEIVCCVRGISNFSFFLVSNIL